MSNMTTGFIGWHVNQVTCITGRQVVVIVMSFMRISVMVGHAYMVGTYYRSMQNLNITCSNKYLPVKPFEFRGVLPLKT